MWLLPQLKQTLEKILVTPTLTEECEVFACAGRRKGEGEWDGEGKRWDLMNHTSQQCFPRQVLWVLEKADTYFLYFKESNVYKINYF